MYLCFFLLTFLQYKIRTSKVGHFDFNNIEGTLREFKETKKTTTDDMNQLMKRKLTAYGPRINHGFHYEVEVNARKSRRIPVDERNFDRRYNYK